MKRRLAYAAVFAVLLGIEILIALFVRDAFVRPYLGDVLVTVLICCFVRIFVPDGWRFLPLGVLAFAAAVELGQYFDYAALLGADAHPVWQIVLGSTFSAADLICYAVGCGIFHLADTLTRRDGRNR